MPITDDYLPINFDMGNLIKFLFFTVFSTGGAQADDSTCYEPDVLAPDVSLSLIRAYQRNGNHVGSFALINHASRLPIELYGRHRGNKYYLEYPDVAVEFKDLNGLWSVFRIHSPGTYSRQNEHLAIQTGKTAVFDAELFARNVPVSGYSFRLVLKLTQPDRCVVSSPFRALPDRASITHFVAENPP